MKTLKSRQGFLCVALLCLPGVLALGQEAGGFNPKDFKLSDLVADLDSGNYFKMPEKAKAYLREVQKSNVDFEFKSHDKADRYAYISSDMQPTIWIKLSAPRARLGEAICHELLHFEDFHDFKTIKSFNVTRSTQDYPRLFGTQLGTIVNIVSHEFVRRGLVDIGFADSWDARVTDQVSGMDTRLSKLERTFENMAAQLAAKPGQPGKTAEAGLGLLEKVYQDMMMIVLRDALLLEGRHAKEIDALLARFAHIMEFIQAGTRTDPRARCLRRDVRASAGEIRKAIDRYQSSDRSTADRYALIPAALNSMYGSLGAAFHLIPKDAGAPEMGARSTVATDGAPILIEGKFSFADVKPFKRYGEKPDSPVVPAAKLGDEAAPLSIQKWVKGDPVNLADAKGKQIVVVEFWATWCRPCRTSIPHLTAIQKQFKDQNVVMIGVSREDASKVKPFVEKQGDQMDYRVAIDKNGKTSDDYLRAFGARGIPHAFIVNKQGRIVWQGHPMRPDLSSTIKKLLANTD